MNNQLDNKNVLEKEIDLIQNCITRMSQNSFNVKGWLIALIVAIIALLPENINTVAVCFIVIGTTSVFWYLDGFFLKIETLYRWKYNWVISKRLTSDDFYYDLNPHNKEMWLTNDGKKTEKEPCVFVKMFTKTLWPFYLLIIIAALIVILTQDSTHQFFADILKFLKIK